VPAKATDLEGSSALGKGKGSLKRAPKGSGDQQPTRSKREWIANSVEEYLAREN